MAKTVTSLFRSESEASSIVRRLEDAGVASGSICLFTESGGSNRFWEGTGGADDDASGSSSDRVSNYLTRNGVPAGDAHSFAEGVRRGHALVAVRCDDDEVDRVIAILDGDDTLDLDEHESAWRSEGWTGSTGSAGSGMATGLSGAGALSGSSGMSTSGTGAATGMAGAGLTGTSGMGAGTGMAGAGLTGSSGASASGMGSSTGTTGAGLTGSSGMSRTTGERDEVIPVAEEELHVSKRETNRGRVRIHSQVVERPVQEQVTLREENVHVERRPVEGSTRTGAVSGDALFEERTIEMDETREEAVVSKEARVKEELVIKKDVEQRTETISDTVRSTEVTVEDERGNKVPGSGATDRKI
jgi:uncharacterized protein (TIGR02271 family)